MKKIRFIINPKSGTGKKKNIPDLIEQHLDKNKYESEICFTQYSGHATQLASEARENNYDIVVVVGGDGSVNEVATALVDSKTVLGIIPAGSGNGLALHLKIPVDTVQAIKLLNDPAVDRIDTLTVNDHFCVGTIGIGFDAHIAHLFAQSSKRGYYTYVKLVLSEFSSFIGKKFYINVDGINYEKDCFLLTFANSSQFGNNAVIAPFADVKDGIIEISMMRKFPAIAAPFLIYRLMRNSIHLSRYFQSLKGKNIIVKNGDDLQGHIDGEPVVFKSDLIIKIKPLTLNVLVPGIK